MQEEEFYGHMAGPTRSDPLVISICIANSDRHRQGIEASIIAELVHRARSVCFGRSALFYACRAVTLAKRDQPIADS